MRKLLLILFVLFGGLFVTTSCDEESIVPENELSKTEKTGSAGSGQTDDPFGN